MKRSLPFLAIALFAFAALAEEATKPLDPKIERAVRDAVTLCPGMKVSASEIPFKLPSGFTGAVVKMESTSARCDSQIVQISSPSGGFFLGIPWYFAGEEGATPEEKLKNFVWRNMQMTVTPVVDRATRTAEGLFRVTLAQSTEAGKINLEGSMDPAGTIFFFGQFRRGDVRGERLKAFEPLLATAPSKGAKDPAVTVIEFSDFQCPSCKYASGYLEPIMAKHGDKVRYIRYDLPLSGHTWAFAAAMAGRAVFHQKPELFWDYKKAIYANQDKLSAFTFDDFARGFAESHDLDMKQWDTDVASDAVKNELLKAVGVAFSNDIRATPSYIVNGTLIDAGENGKGLEEYVEKLLAGK